ncbi:hypothetical protein SAMN05216206_2252 [Pseudomonas guineae]|uniref:Uncharacterized protein n=1 Tax=Pseudomonas guineae TaxID=425504 RepID=A0A1I3I725_9PSED|nr:hypothetical protein SAMN05216206_2252 [Pseudomonas guineae]
MKNGGFHKISMNYGVSVNRIFKTLRSIKPTMTFSNTANISYHLSGKKINNA